jgi:hypothetical protein
MDRPAFHDLLLLLLAAGAALLPATRAAPAPTAPAALHQQLRSHFGGSHYMSNPAFDQPVNVPGMVMPLLDEVTIFQPPSLGELDARKIAAEEEWRQLLERRERREAAAAALEVAGASAFDGQGGFRFSQVGVGGSSSGSGLLQQPAAVADPAVAEPQPFVSNVDSTPPPQQQQQPSAPAESQGSSSIVKPGCPQADLSSSGSSNSSSRFKQKLARRFGPAERARLLRCLEEDSH